MTKGDLIQALSGVTDDTPIYLRAMCAELQCMMVSVECTSVDDTAFIEEDEPIVLLS